MALRVAGEILAFFPLLDFRPTVGKDHLDFPDKSQNPLHVGLRHLKLVFDFLEKVLGLLDLK
jgi:hypothetical protein